MFGMTKAAVYYHFKTKHDIISAVFAEPLGEIESAVEEAEAIEAAGSRKQALEALIPRMVALAVEP